VNEHEAVLLIVGVLVIVIGVTAHHAFVTSVGVGMIIGTVFGRVFLRPS
jgi:hypothetical protein